MIDNVGERAPRLAIVGGEHAPLRLSRQRLLAERSRPVISVS